MIDFKVSGKEKLEAQDYANGIFEVSVEMAKAIGQELDQVWMGLFCSAIANNIFSKDDIPNVMATITKVALDHQFVKKLKVEGAQDAGAAN